MITVAILYIGYSSVQHNNMIQQVLPPHSTLIDAREADDIASGFMHCNTLRWMRTTPAWYILYVTYSPDFITLAGNDMHYI